MSIGQNDSRPIQSARILLVDDNLHGLTARKSILEALGYHVTAEICPCKALESFSVDAFDLVITDFRMPGMDGTDLISQIRQKRPDLPIVLISGFADTLGLNELSTGADVVIQKSNHEVAVMVRSVDRLLNRGRASRKPPGSYRPRSRYYVAAQ